MTDKNIYDALQHRKVTIKAIHENLLDRGILLSLDEEKESVSKYVSGLLHDYHDYMYLGSMLENTNRKEPFTNSVMEVDVESKKIKEYCEEVQAAKEELGETIKISRDGNLTVITATYTEVDHTKTEMTQKTTKQATVEIEKDGAELIIRQQANKKAMEIASYFKKTIKESEGKDDIEIFEKIISLESVAQPEARSHFFDVLIRSVEGYDLDNVKKVDVKYSSEDVEGVTDDEDILGHIQKAVLNGDGVLQSAEFNQLHDSGFYITKITWYSVDSLPGGDRVEFSAGFGNPDKCTDYKYRIGQIFNAKSLSDFNVTGRQPSNVETKVLIRKLEAASLIAYDAVIEKYGIPNDENEE